MSDPRRARADGVHLPAFWPAGGGLSGEAVHAWWLTAKESTHARRRICGVDFSGVGLMASDSEMYPRGTTVLIAYCDFFLITKIEPVDSYTI